MALVEYESGSEHWMELGGSQKAGKQAVALTEREAAGVPALFVF